MSLELKVHNNRALSGPRELLARVKTTLVGGMLASFMDDWYRYSAAAFQRALGGGVGFKNCVNLLFSQKPCIQETFFFFLK